MNRMKFFVKYVRDKNFRKAYDTKTGRCLFLTRFNPVNDICLVRVSKFGYVTGTDKVSREFFLDYRNKCESIHND